MQQNSPLPDFSARNSAAPEQSGACLLCPIPDIGGIALCKTKMSAAIMATLKTEGGMKERPS
jgi:hypothetical protein